MAVSPATVAYTAAGGVLLYSGITGDTVSNAIRSLLKGQKPAGTTTQPQVAAPTAANVVAGNSSGFGFQVTAQSPNGNPPIVKGNTGGTPTANKALGALMAAAYGWGPGSKDWPYLESGWQEESGWSQTAANVPSDPYNHAYGIPQANPGTKMASAGSDWKTSAATQIKWGLGYIKGTYGSPSQVPGWTPNGPAAGYVGY